MPRPLHRRPSPAAAQLAADVLGFALDVPPDAILSLKRGQPHAAAARQVAMYLLNTVFEMSLTQVAISIGRDRSTVAHGLRVVEDRREDPRFDAWLQQLEDALRAAPGARPVFAGAL